MKQAVERQRRIAGETVETQRPVETDEGQVLGAGGPAERVATDEKLRSLRLAQPLQRGKSPEASGLWVAQQPARLRCRDRMGGR